MNNIARLKKAAELYREYEKFQKRLAKFSVNGHGPKKAKKPNKQNQLRGSYMGLVGKLPKRQKDEIKRIFQERGVKAAIRAAQAAVEARNG